MFKKQNHILGALSHFLLTNLSVTNNIFILCDNKINDSSKIEHLEQFEFGTSLFPFVSNVSTELKETAKIVCSEYYVKIASIVN